LPDKSDNSVIGTLRACDYISYISVPGTRKYIYFLDYINHVNAPLFIA